MEINHQTDTITPSGSTLNIIGTLQKNGINILDSNDTSKFNGFVDSTQVTITRNNATREISIAPTGASYEIYSGGIKFVKTGTDTIAVPNTTQLSFIYFDNSGILQQTTTFSSSLLLKNNCYVSNAYWNVAQAKFIFVGLEFHAYDRNWLAHAIRHRQGAAYSSGFALSGFIVDGNGSSNTHAQFTAEAGMFDDEDIRHSWGSTGSIDILYRIGATNWQSKTGNTYPFILSGEESYTGANGRIAYNRLNTGNYELSQVQEGYYTTVSLFAINDSTEKVVGFLGTQEYSTIALARTGALNDIALFGSTLPFQEFIPLGVVILQSSSSYANTPKARVVSTDAGGAYSDLRLTTSYVPINTSNSHLTLGDTTNDACHPQYVLKNILTTKGDILVHDGTSLVRQAVDPIFGKALVADSTSADGLSYKHLGSMYNLSKYQKPLIDEFIGTTTGCALGWSSQTSGTGASMTFSGTLNNQNHPGVAELSTGSTNAGRVIYSTGFWSFAGGLHNKYLGFLIYIPTLSQASQRYTLWVGFQDNYNVATEFGVGACLKYTDNVNSGQWQLMTCQVSRTTQNTTTAVVTGWQYLSMQFNSAGTSVTFFYNGVQIGTPIATNTPTGNCGLSVKMVKSLGTNPVTVSLDYAICLGLLPNGRDGENT